MSLFRAQHSPQPSPEEREYLTCGQLLSLTYVRENYVVFLKAKHMPWALKFPCGPPAQNRTVFNPDPSWNFILYPAWLCSQHWARCWRGI